MSQMMPPVQQQPSPAMDASQAQVVAQLQALETSAARGARWFYWIAGLSAVNMVLTLSGSGTYFVIGLGIPMIATMMLKSMGSAGTTIAIGLNVVILGVFALFGKIALGGRTWAFIVGMVLYLVDGLVFLLVQDWMSVGFHAFVLICLGAGVRAMLRANSLKATLLRYAQPAAPYPPQSQQLYRQ